MHKFEFYTSLPMSRLKLLLAILESGDVSVVSTHMENDVAHVTVNGDWETYQKVLDSNITYSLEHFQE
jgi:hypothetical protein